MKRARPLIRLLPLAAILATTGCVEEMQQGASTSTGATAANPAPTSQAAATAKLTKHDAALRFLTAYIRLDRKMALQYATPTAISKLDWNRSHGGNVPYYDDKMLLHFSGGWARVYFQEVNGSYIVSNLEVHRR